MTGEPGPETIRFAGLSARSTWGRWVVVAGYMLAIFLLSSQSSLPELPGAPSDKLQHVVAYAILSALMVWALSRGAWAAVTARTVILATLMSTLYGYSDECHQLFVPRRQYDLKDLAADGAGALMAAGALWAWGIIARGSGRTHGV